MREQIGEGQRISVEARWRQVGGWAPTVVGPERRVGPERWGPLLGHSKAKATTSEYL